MIVVGPKLQVCRSSRKFSVALSTIAVWFSITATAALPPEFHETAVVRSQEPNAPLNGPIALHGDTLLAGSIVHQETGEPDFRSRFVVFAFQRSPTTGAWTPSGVLARFDVVDDWPHPLHLAIEGTTAVVATYGHARVFTRGSGGWAQTAELARPEGYEYGSGAAIAGDYILLGGESSTRMAGLLYRRDNAGRWPLQQILQGGVTHPGDGFFGAPVDLSRDLAVVGHMGMFDPSVPGPSAYAYVRGTDGAWLPQSYVRIGEGPVAVQDEVIIGSSTELANVGPQAHIYDGAFWGYRGRAQVLHPWSTLDVSPRPAANGDRYMAVGLPPTVVAWSSPGYVLVYARTPGEAEAFRPVAMLRERRRVTLGNHVAVDRNRVAAHSVNAWAVFIFDLPRELNANPSIMQDDFEDGSASEWRTSTSSWSVTPYAGSRVFLQPAVSGDRRAVLRGIDWRNQAIEADIRVTGYGSATLARGAALMVRYVNDNNYYYALLSPRIGGLALYRRVNGVERLLGTSQLQVVANRTYRLRLAAVRTHIEVGVDGRRHFGVRDDALSHGAPGLRTLLARTHFDNIVVSPNSALRLTEIYAEEVLGRWALTPPDGWSRYSTDESYVLRNDVATPLSLGILGIDHDHWPGVPQLADHSVQARVRVLAFASADAPGAGIVARVRDNENYIALSLNGSGSVSLRKVDRGVVEVLDRMPFQVETGVSYELRLEAVGDRLRGYVNGTAVVESKDTSMPDPNFARTRYGVMAREALAEFEGFLAVHP